MIFHLENSNIVNVYPLYRVIMNCDYIPIPPLGFLNVKSVDIYGEGCTFW